MKLYKSESYLIVIVVLVAITLNLSTFFYRSLTTPKDRVFAGTQFYSDDYAVYVSYIKQGQEGRWTTVDKFTSELHPSSLIHEEYLLWGKLTGFLGIQPVLAYHLSRLIFGLVFLVFIYLLLLKVFRKREESIVRITCFLLICFAAGFLDKSGQPYLGWLTEMDISQKFGSLFHYLLGFICLLGIFRFILNDDEHGLTRIEGLVLFFLGFLMAFVLPSGSIVAVTTLTIFILLSGQRKKLILPIIVIVAASIPAFVYDQLIFNVSPWSHILAWERINRGPFTFIQYLLALGSTAFLAPLGLLAWRQHSRLVAFLVSWIIAVFGWAFVFGDFLKLNPTRFLQNPVYIPLAIMTVLGLKVLCKNKDWLLMLIVLLAISVSLPTTSKSLNNHLQMYADHTELIYPGRNLMEAFAFLDKNTQPQQTVLSLYMAGNLIPFLAGNGVYLGHLQETVDYGQKVENAGRFYSGLLPEDEARSFLRQANISLVFYSPQEKASGGGIAKYPFLKPIFENETTTIFKND